MNIPEDAPVMLAFRDYQKRTGANGIDPGDFDWFRAGFIFGATQGKKAIEETEKLEAALAAAQTPPALDEPVAVIDESDDGKFADLLLEGTFLKRGTKLYAVPQNTKLRKAAEELNQFIHDGMRFDDDAYKTEMLRLVENLRSALEGK